MRKREREYLIARLRTSSNEKWRFIIQLLEHGAFENKNVTAVVRTTSNKVGKNSTEALGSGR
jgi:hypothetical protein